MDKEVKQTLMDAVVGGTIKSVQNLFNNNKLELDDSYFDYKLLKAAVSRNNLGIIKFLLKIGCRAVNPNNSKTESLLHIAIKDVRSFTEEIVKRLIEKGASVYDKNLKGETSVLAAFREGNHRIVNALLLTNYNTTYNSNDKDDLLHFHIACIINNYYCADRYLKCGIDPNVHFSLDSEKYDQLSPIEFAIHENYFNLFEVLVQYNVDLSVKNSKDLTVLHKLYYSNHPNNGKIWIEAAFKSRNHKKFINCQDKYKVSFFHLCCMVDEPNLVQVFIDTGVNVNDSVSLKCPVNPGFTALHFAIKYNCYQVLELLLRNGADPNKSDKQGQTPLHMACKKSDNLSAITMLLEYKASPIFANKEGSTPLHMTFYYKNNKDMYIFNTLISKIQWGSDNFTDRQGLSLFHIACTTNNINQVIKFLNAGVQIDSSVSTGIYSGFTALHFAVMYNRKEIVKILLKKNAKVNKKLGELSVTPLHLACEFNYMMFEDEVPFNWVGSYYMPLSSDLTYSRTNQLEIINLLLSHGSDVNVKDSFGITPLLHACMIDRNYLKLDWTYLIPDSSTKERVDLANEISNRLAEIIEILISNKANIESQTNSKASILHIICKYSTLKISEKLMKFLVGSGADVNAVDNEGLTPLHIAVKYSNKILVRRLLKYNANPNIKCKNSRIPLHMVVKRIVGHGIKIREAVESDIFCALVEYGSDVNIRDEDGSTVFLTALSNSKDSMVEKLLYYGADVNMIDLSGNLSGLSRMLEWEERSHRYMAVLYGKMFQCIYLNVQKLLALGLPVSREVQDVCTRLLSYYNTDYHQVEGLKKLENVFDKCINELERMKSIKIDVCTSLYDILLKDPHELVKYVNNKNLINAVKEDTKYPLYSYLLKLKFNKGLKRSKVLQSAETALENVLHLPNLCCNLILKYLTNEEIDNVKEAASMKVNLKRKLCDNNLNRVESESKTQKRKIQK